MGVLQRFERRLGGLVEGAFARAFKSELQPVEVASAIQREMDERAAIVAQGRTLVPNDFVVEVSADDLERLYIYAESLGVELATVAREYAAEQGYSFVGPVRVRFEQAVELTTGLFRIRSGVLRGTTVESGEMRQPASHQSSGVSNPTPGRPRLLVSTRDESRGGGFAAEHEQAYELTTPVIVLGRGTDCDLRLVDPGVSRHHAEIRFEGEDVVLVDLGSTNGTVVDGQPARRAVLRDGGRIELGRTILIFRRDGTG